MESGVNIHVANKMSSKKWDANKIEINPPSVIPIHWLLFLHSSLWLYSTIYILYSIISLTFSPVPLPCCHVCIRESVFAYYSHNTM